MAEELKPCQKGEQEHHYIPKRDKSSPASDPVFVQTCLYCGETKEYEKK